MRDVSKDSAAIDSQQGCGTSGIYCIRMTFMIIKMEEVLNSNDSNNISPGTKKIHIYNVMKAEMERWQEGACCGTGSRGDDGVEVDSVSNAAAGAECVSSKKQTGLTPRWLRPMGTGRVAERVPPGARGEALSNHSRLVPPLASFPIKVPTPTHFSLNLIENSILQEISKASGPHQKLLVPFIYETPFDLSAKCSEHCKIKLFSLQC